jgi:hypothetical protein
MVWGRFGTSGVCTMGGGPSAEFSCGAAIIPAPHANALLKKLRLLLTSVSHKKVWIGNSPYGRLLSRQTKLSCNA